MFLSGHGAGLSPPPPPSDFVSCVYLYTVCVHILTLFFIIELKCVMSFTSREKGHSDKFSCNHFCLS